MKKIRTWITVLPEDNISMSSICGAAEDSGRKFEPGSIELIKKLDFQVNTGGNNKIDLVLATIELFTGSRKGDYYKDVVDSLRRQNLQPCPSWAIPEIIRRMTKISLLLGTDPVHGEGGHINFLYVTQGSISVYGNEHDFMPGHLYCVFARPHTSMVTVLKKIFGL